MHRHGYQGRKLSLERDQRRALIRGQVTSLVLYESITTTEAKAKQIAPVFERLVTKAKVGTLAAQRALRETLLTENAVQKLIQELAPGYAKRNGGYTRITKAGTRRGDNAPMAVVSLVLPERAEVRKTEDASQKTEVTNELNPSSNALSSDTPDTAKPGSKAKAGAK